MKSTNRPSPSKSATDFETGTRKRGNDGNMYTVVSDKNGKKRWIRSSSTNICYRLYDVSVTNESNYGPLFMVKIKQSHLTSSTIDGRLPLVLEKGVATIHLIRTDEDGYIDGIDDSQIDPRSLREDTRFYFQKPRFTFHFQCAYLGYDPAEFKGQNWWEKLTGKRAPFWYGGNAVLLRVSSNRYIVAADQDIHSFSTQEGEHILSFVSQIGNSSVAYPYAISNMNVYDTTLKIRVPLADVHADPHTLQNTPWDKKAIDSIQTAVMNSTKSTSRDTIYDHRVIWEIKWK